MTTTIAVIGSLDTKASELEYMEKEIQRMHCNTLLFDISGLEHSVTSPKADITNKQLAAAAGYSWDEVRKQPKNKILDIITEGLRIKVFEYYKKGAFQGIISAGGMQNTMISKTAMMELPYGFPKINIAASMSVVEIDNALGRTDDVSTINSIADIGGGVNEITGRIITEGVAALVGMMQYGRGEMNKIDKPIIGITNLGVISEGTTKINQYLKEDGYESCMFHGTMHGAVLEKLVREGVISGVMMLCVHDILTEALDKYRFCDVPVLKAPAEMKIPTLISLSGMDVIDISDKEFTRENFPDIETRKYHYHNDICVHVKTTKEEILKGGELLAERLNAFTSPVTVLMPLKGFRTFTREGEPLYDPEVDGALIRYLHENLNPSVRIVEVDANANDEEFARTAVSEMERLLNRRN
jgi:uncharacterized protein (UPF0261 family)